MNHILTRVIFFVLFLFIFTEGKPAPNREIIRNKCIEKSGIEPEILHDAEKSQVLPDIYPYKKFLRCTSYAFGLQDNNGKFDPDKVKEFLIGGVPEANIHLIVDPCVHFEGETPMETAYLTVKCILKRKLLMERKTAPIIYDEDESLNML